MSNDRPVKSKIKQRMLLLLPMVVVLPWTMMLLLVILKNKRISILEFYFFFVSHNVQKPILNLSQLFTVLLLARGYDGMCTHNSKRSTTGLGVFFCKTISKLKTPFNYLSICLCKTFSFWTCTVES